MSVQDILPVERDGRRVYELRTDKLVAVIDPLAGMHLVSLVHLGDDHRPDFEVIAGPELVARFDPSMPFSGSPLLFPYANRDFYYYPVGVNYPSTFNYYNVPYQYQSFYPDGNDLWYRYGDGAIYTVDPATSMVSGIAALLTWAPLAVGQGRRAGQAVAVVGRLAEAVRDPVL